MDSGARGRSGRRIRARCGNILGSGSLAGGAGKGLNASASFSGLGGDDAVIPSVGGSIQFFIAALFSAAMPVLRFVVKPLCGVWGMGNISRCRECFGFGSIADGAGEGLHARLGFGGLGSDNAAIPSVGGKIQFFAAAFASAGVPVLRFVVEPFFAGGMGV